MSEKKFSEMLSRLEEIVTTLEKGDCELEASMELFDEGTTLAKICNEKLKKKGTDYVANVFLRGYSGSQLRQI